MRKYIGIYGTEEITEFVYTNGDGCVEGISEISFEDFKEEFCL